MERHDDSPSPAHRDDDAPAMAAGHDRRRVLRAFNVSLGVVLLLAAVYSAQGSFDWTPLAVAPHAVAGLWGVLTAPLLHASATHLAANAVALLILGTLAGSVYPRATLCALPLLWLGSGLGAWWLGEPGTRHLGASGVAHGLLFLVFVLGLLRRDRAAIAAGMIAFLFYGGMLITVLPHTPGVSWQSHLGGALGGVLAALLFRRSDPPLPRRHYDWEDEADEAAVPAESDDATPFEPPFEPPSPRELPAPWRPVADSRGVVLRFVRPSGERRGPREP